MDREHPGGAPPLRWEVQLKGRHSPRARQQLRGQEPLGHQPSDLSEEASLRFDQSLTALRDESEGGICEYEVSSD